MKIHFYSIFKLKHFHSTNIYIVESSVKIYCERVKPETVRSVLFLLALRSTSWSSSCVGHLSAQNSRFILLLYSEPRVNLCACAQKTRSAFVFRQREGCTSSEPGPCAALTGRVGPTEPVPRGESQSVSVRVRIVGPR